jgi:hypothetical protein
LQKNSQKQKAKPHRSMTIEESDKRRNESAEMRALGGATVGASS